MNTATHQKLVIAAFLAAMAAPAAAASARVTVSSLSPGSFCHDANMQTLPGHIRPKLPFDANYIPIGRVMTRIDGLDCYFYTAEIGTGDPKACPSVAVAEQDGTTNSGTRGQPCSP